MFQELELWAALLSALSVLAKLASDFYTRKKLDKLLERLQKP